MKRELPVLTSVISAVFFVLRLAAKVGEIDLGRRHLQLGGSGVMRRFERLQIGQQNNGHRHLIVGTDLLAQLLGQIDRGLRQTVVAQFLGVECDSDGAGTSRRQCLWCDAG